MRGPLAVLLLAVAVEPILAEQPAEHGRAGPASGDAIGALGQALRRLGEAPGAQLVDIGDAERGRPAVALAGQDGELIALALEALRLGGMAHPRRLRLQPGLEALLVDELERGRGLALVGLKEGREISHGRALAEPRPARHARRHGNRPGPKVYGEPAECYPACGGKVLPSAYSDNLQGGGYVVVDHIGRNGRLDRR